jgi:multidrug efflux pump subunit AcrA (membrane-fusion protein)
VNRYILGSFLLIHTLFALDVPIDEVERRTFSEEIITNSQVVQLLSAKSTLMARLGGKIVAYHVQEGDSVKQGQVVATIESLELASQLTELKGLEAQLSVVQRNYAITNKLYNIGVESLQKLNQQDEEKMVISNQIEVLKSKLAQIKGRKGNRYSVYAQSSGRVEKILAPIHSVVSGNEPLLSIAKGRESFLIKSFIPLKYATKIRIGQRGVIIYGAEEHSMHITQILPNIDQETQQMTVLSKLDTPVHNLFVNTFLDSKLFFGEGKRYLSVKKSALSFFNNEWVVFVPEHHEEEHGDDKHKEEAPHQEEEKLDNEHHGHEEEEVPYDIKVIKILKDNGKFVAIEGLEEHQDYVSDKSYYIKSLLLKSSLGGHGH